MVQSIRCKGNMVDTLDRGNRASHNSKDTWRDKANTVEKLMDTASNCKGMYSTKNIMGNLILN